MYRGMKSIKLYNSKTLFPAHLLKCTCWCQSRVKPQDGMASAEMTDAYRGALAKAIEQALVVLRTETK